MTVYFGWWLFLVVVKGLNFACVKGAVVDTEVVDEAVQEVLIVTVGPEPG